MQYRTPLVQSAEPLLISWLTWRGCDWITRLETTGKPSVGFLLEDPFLFLVPHLRPLFWGILMLASEVRFGERFCFLNQLRNYFRRFIVSATATVWEHRLWVHQFTHAWSHATLPHSRNTTTLCAFSDEVLGTMKIGRESEFVGIFQICDWLLTKVAALSNIPFRRVNGMSMICASSGDTDKDGMSFVPGASCISVILIEKNFFFRDFFWRSVIA